PHESPRDFERSYGPHGHLGDLRRQMAAPIKLTANYFAYAVDIQEDKNVPSRREFDDFATSLGGWRRGCYCCIRCNHFHDDFRLQRLYAAASEFVPMRVQEVRLLPRRGWCCLAL